MPKKHLTPINVVTLPTKSKPYQVWDTGTDAAQGLGVLVSPNGVRTYRAIYYYPGSSKPYALKLGRVGEMALDEAREKTREIRGLARKGLDPKRGDPARSSDFKGAVEYWTKTEQIGRKGNKSAHECESFMLASTPAWHVRPIATIRKAEIEELLHVKRDSGRGYAANRLHAHLATFFRWCVRQERIVSNPMADMPPPWDGAEARYSEWFKGDKADEVIRGLWQLAGKLGGDDERFLKLLLITGKRRRAIETMQWEHIVNWYWSPTLGNKRKRCHAIPLPKLAQRVMGPHQKAGRVISRRTAKLQTVVRRELQLPDFIFHSIRHIVETKLAELRLPESDRDRLLDHAPRRGSGRGYDHHSYRDEMLEGLETWCAHIEKLVTPKGKARQRARS